MATLYSYTSTNNNTGWNWNGANDNGAVSFTPTITWIPTQLIWRNFSVSWTPIVDIYIKSDKTDASTTYAQALWVTMTSGTNTINLTPMWQINSGTRYWVYMKRISNVSNFFRFYNEYTSPPSEQYWRSSASNIDPDIRYDSWSKNIGASMDIKWNLTSKGLKF